MLHVSDSSEPQISGVNIHHVVAATANPSVGGGVQILSVYQAVPAPEARVLQTLQCLVAFVDRPDVLRLPVLDVHLEGELFHRRQHAGLTHLRDGVPLGVFDVKF